MASTPSIKSGTKSTKQSKKVTLHLRPELLSKFSSDPVPPSKVTVKASPKSSAKPSPKVSAKPSPKPSAKSSPKPSPNPSPSEDASVPASTPVINAPPADKTTESTSGSPAPNAASVTDDSKSLAPPSTKRKGVPGPKPGSKRSAPSGETTPKPRGKPGPKKKPRLADGTIDRSADPTKKGPFGGVAPITAHKLGPKANTGAINAGLRALDRSGKPCRRWERKGFTLKSISGVTWSVGSWMAPVKETTFSGDVKSESSGSSEDKAHMESSAVPSERSASNAGAYGQGRTNELESSPAPVVPAAA